jgi:PKD repeat protein
VLCVAVAGCAVDNGEVPTLAGPSTASVSSAFVAPTAGFDVIPDPPEIGAPVTFDATKTTRLGVRCDDACTYSWNFGDGTTASGRIVTKTFTAAGKRTVTLTVTDAAGSGASTARTVTVAGVDAPTVTLTVAPDPPLAGQPAVLTADADADDGHSIVRYSWDFGDGTTETTTSSSISKTYTTRGTYVARVTVTDDVGQTASASKSFTISGSGVTASFTISPKEPEEGESVYFDGSASSGAGGATITEWTWDFGDGGDPVEDNDPTVSHTYADSGEYVVRLTVTDSQGRTGTTTATVEVSEP